MRVVLGVHHYPPTRVAGVELITERVARWLARHGHDVEVVAVEDIDAVAPLTVRTDQQDGVVVHRLGLKLTGRAEPLGMRYRDEAVGEWFTSYLTRTRPDVFHSQSCYLLTASTIESATRLGVPVVATLHDYWFLCPRLTMLRPNGSRSARAEAPATCSWCLHTERRRYRVVDAAWGRLRGSQTGQGGDAPWFHSLMPDELTASIRARQAYLSSVLRSVQLILTPSVYARELLLAEGLPPQLVELAPYGLELAQPAGQGAPRQELPANSPLRIGYLGQLAPHKGVHVLVQAFRQLASTASGAELRIFGDPSRFPEYSQELLALAADDQRIRFAGPYDNSQVTRILADLDVVVVPSTWFEIYPLVVLEAFAARVPVVATGLPNLQNMVRDGLDGLLFEANDARDLARQLQRLADNRGLLTRLSEGILPIRTTDDEMTALVASYQSVVEQPQTPRGDAGRRMDPVLPGEAASRELVTDT